MQQVAPALNRSVYHGVQQINPVSPVPDTLAWAVEALSLPGENLDVYASPSWASGGETAGLPMQENHNDYSRAVQHALVMGPSGHV